jgi:GNAT superfamily N-acetyltransferase
MIIQIAKLGRIPVGSDTHQTDRRAFNQRVAGASDFAVRWLDSPLREWLFPACQLGKVVACGLGVLEGLYVGLYDIITAPAWRNQGLGHALVHDILAWGKQGGARTAYLRPMHRRYGSIRSWGSQKPISTGTGPKR